MPVITAEKLPERRQGGRRWLCLLLLPPLLLAGLLLSAAVRPLQLGSWVLTTQASRTPGFGWKPRYFQLLRPPTYSPLWFERGRYRYRVTGEARMLTVGLGNWTCEAVCFRGHRQPEAPSAR